MSWTDPSILLVLGVMAGYCSIAGIACSLLEADGWDGGSVKPSAGLGAAFWPIVLVLYVSWAVAVLPYRATNSLIRRSKLPRARVVK